MIQITRSIALHEDEISETFVRASGPGGQNVNKVSSAVQLRFDVRHSPNLPEDVRARLEKLSGQRLTTEGVLIIFSQVTRSQERNRADALARLVELVRKAAVRPVIRRATKPTLASKKRRLDSKSRRSGIKGLRSGKPEVE